ncbi:MAG: hypothetical protein M1821_007360 [Bathelium mastoideum]|nr:MAG: hypothetical protein M1821_007360 [Bathelium mastoideum]
MSQQIPQPPGLPFLGNLLDVQDEVPVRALAHLADIYGPIYKLYFGRQPRVIVSGSALVRELCDETRFCKTFSTTLRPSTGARGLFTAPHESDPDWQQAHRTLIPAFGPLAISGMFDEMHDIASQLVLKWARMGPEYRIPVTSDFTRLTLDTIALCAMDFRFNSFYQDELHPFVTAMNKVLSTSSNRSMVSSLLKNLILGPDKSVQESNDYMDTTALQLVQHRRNHPTDKRDLLNAMLYGKDPKTGEHMRDELIAANMRTFLVAGHETTSGLLSFAFAHLLKNPATYFTAQAEVDRICGRARITADHVKELSYLNAVLKETLRLNPTVPAFSRSFRPENDVADPTLGNGKHAVDKGDSFLVLLNKSQSDPAVYGEDSKEFRPERMLGENFDKLPKGAWQPFGTGLRACIGRAFAWQEALMTTALLLQNFNFRLDDPNYEIKIKQTLTLKPDEFYMRASLREGITATKLQESLTAPKDAQPLADNVSLQRTQTIVDEGSESMAILYGSNTGTCEAFARKLASDCKRHGFKATVADLDSAVDRIAKGPPTIIITASYDGQPADNARQFFAWLQALGSQQKLVGVNYAVFGCGHSDWKATFQRVPAVIDEAFERLGAKRLVDRGLSNAAQEDMPGDFELWNEKTLWPTIHNIFGGSEAKIKLNQPETNVEISTGQRATRLTSDVRPGRVIKAESLTATGEPEKRHLEIQLPSDMSYSAGDYLAVLPMNPDETVRRVLTRYSLPWDATITIKDGGPENLPIKTAMSIFDLLKGYIELSQPAARSHVQACGSSATDSADKACLETLADVSFQDEIVERRTSLLDLLERYPSIDIPFPKFLTLLSPMRPRYYSISSSPLTNPTTCTITYAVIDSPGLSGQGRFIGVTGSYLSDLRAGDQVQVSVRSTNKFFRLPNDITNTPLLMLCAGTGIAPLRGFVQERATQIEAGRKDLARALLFVGCRSDSTDRLYAEEFDRWAAMGAVDVRYAFSQEPEKSDGCKYLQDRMLRNKDDIRDLWRKGAKVYVCGSPEIAMEAGKAARQIVKEAAAEMGTDGTDETVDKWFETNKNERIVSDVFR